MTSNLKFSRKTWYALLLLAAAVSLLGGFFALTGHSFGILDQLAFGCEALAALFLAAEKDNQPKDRNAYFLVFVVLMLGYIAGAPLGHLLGALPWPLLLLAEQRRGQPVADRLRLVVFAEVMHLALLLMTLAGLNASLMTNLFWVLTGVARGAAALALYKAHDRGAEG